MSSYIFIFLLIININNISGAKILGLFSDISRSHSTQNRPLFRALAARGHQVTILSAFPEEKKLKNYRDIHIEGLTEYTDKHVDFQEMTTTNVAQAFLTKLKYAYVFKKASKKAFLSNGTQTLIKSNEKFDLIFVDLTSASYNLGFVHKFGNPPFIGIIPFGSNVNTDMLVGNPTNPAFVPCIFLPVGNRMSFFERFINTIENFLMYHYLNYAHYPKADRLIRERFGGDVPDSLEIAKNMSLLMVNTDVAHDYPRALSPMTVEIGGLHLKPAEKLPQDIKTFIDDSQNGVIFFSLGSLIRSDKITPNKLHVILETFRSLPQRVLWKWESNTIQNLPPNVMVRKWLPQNDILGDRRVKLFITHGGISSLEEAVYHRVPMVVLPLFGDQFFQAKKMEYHGIGRKVDYQFLNKETFLEAIRGVLKNSSYKRNINRISRISRDKIKSPLQTAIFWTEYVLRHGASQHLRPAGTFESWPRFYLLDVLPAIGLSVLLIAISVLMLLMKLQTTGVEIWIGLITKKLGVKDMITKIRIVVLKNK